MKKILTLALLAVSASFSFTSCEKDKEKIDVTKNAFLYERAWVLKSAVYTDDIDVEFPAYIDLYSTMEPCQKDDYYYFNTKNSGELHEYFIKCNEDNPNFIPFYFNITDNDSYITIYTNPEDPGASVIMSGIMTTPNIDEFKVVNRYFDGTTEKNVQYEYVFEPIIPSDI